MIDLEQHGDTLVLRFRQPARDRAVWTVGIMACALVSLFAFGRIFPPGTTGFLAVSGVVGLIAVSAIGIVLQVPTVTGVTATFDVPARQIQVVTDREGHELRDKVAFDVVRELALVTQSHEGNRLETVRLFLQDGRTVFLGHRKQSRAYSLKPYATEVSAILATIRDATGLPGPPAQPLRAVGAAIGITRT